MNKKLLIASVFAIYVIGYSVAYGTAGVAYAQYMGNVGGAGETGEHTLEENLELARRRIEAAEANPASGSGTPYLDASGVVGASIIAGAVFGGIATAFFVRARSGKYAAMGRG
ncbi:hypothetical protein GWO13_04390 [Candidatus Bathyarchaeota archaeon]|nr:hypothetical protein [Candidatus Bathyarchaeota archaeon]